MLSVMFSNKLKFLSMKRERRVLNACNIANCTFIAHARSKGKDECIVSCSHLQRTCRVTNSRRVKGRTDKERRMDAAGDRGTRTQRTALLFFESVGATLSRSPHHRRAPPRVDGATCWMLRTRRKLNGRVERARAVFSTFQHHFRAVRTKRRWWLWRELETLLRACIHLYLPPPPHSQHRSRAAASLETSNYWPRRDSPCIWPAGVYSADANIYNLRP